ncbi:hypothetical protein [Parvularcula sp. LCG005]|uniref:hypothetical protein n=1 Tax=Parvularcula sp. LCG005 TaxID=3078805 RepID=UPI00294312E0|nr:hypothetical protein [Parvularcula sp. LCG005]WOI54317.1 hypothetical protein RUI03_04775 [Parvularcula sp. LCG005]
MAWTENKVDWLCRFYGNMWSPRCIGWFIDMPTTAVQGKIQRLLDAEDIRMVKAQFFRDLAKQAGVQEINAGQLMALRHQPGFDEFIRDRISQARAA